MWQRGMEGPTSGFGGDAAWFGGCACQHHNNASIGLKKGDMTKPADLGCDRVHPYGAALEELHELALHVIVGIAANIVRFVLVWATELCQCAFQALSPEISSLNPSDADMGTDTLFGHSGR